MSKLKRYTLITLGFISFGLGVLGAFLPVLPTTTFILISAYCFGKSSERFEAWLRTTKIYQEYCADYVAHRSIPKKKKRQIVATSYIVMAISIFFAPIRWVKILLTAVAIWLTVLFFLIIPDTEDVFDAEGRYIGPNKKVKARYGDVKVDLKTFEPISQEKLTHE